MVNEVRLTTQTVKVLSAILSRPRDGMAGSDLSRETGLASGTLYPILMRLEKAGWLSSDWEQGIPAELGRPRKRFYKITATGANALRQVTRELSPGIGDLQWI
jgi:DNA-binding PadR family transcriptional regulator